MKFQKKNKSIHHQSKVITRSNKLERFIIAIQVGIYIYYILSLYIKIEFTNSC